jgi:hypothetical protein
VLFSKMRYLLASTQIIYEVLSRSREICMETGREVTNVKCS